MKYLVIDITYLAHWRGKLTGVSRVIDELVSRYAEKDNCLFVVWSETEGAFYRADLAATLQTRGHKLHYMPKNALAAHAKVPLAPLGMSIRVLLRARNNHNAPVPASVLKTLGTIHKSRFAKYTGRPGDTMLIPMGEWNSKAYADKVLRYHHKGVKLVQISYDMLPIVAPQYSGHSTKIMATYGKKVYPVCDLMLVISQQTKEDLTAWLKQQKLRIPRIETFRLGDDFRRAATQKPTGKGFVRSKLKGNDYILCVGTVEARKNHTLLYYTYKLAAERGIALPKIVIVGRRGWCSDNIYDIITHDPQTRENMLFLLDTSDEELSWLYEHCLFSIYPSFYEGWGLPIAESIAHGVPCLASNTSSMPEIAGNLIDYFNPVSPEDCLGAIERMLRPGAIDKAKQRVAKYKPVSWETTFQQVDTYMKEIYE